MPFYEYLCEDCGDCFPALRPIADRDQPIECARCGKGRTHRVLSTFATPGASAAPRAGAPGSTDCAPGFG